MDNNRISTDHFKINSSEGSRATKIESIMAIQTKRQIPWKAFSTREYFPFLWGMRQKDEHTCTWKGNPTDSICLLQMPPEYNVAKGDCDNVPESIPMRYKG